MKLNSREITKSILALLFLVLNTSPLYSITVDEIALKMKKAVDPDGVYAECKSFYIRQKLTSKNNASLIIESTFKPPDRSIVTTSFNGLVILKTVCDGDKAWSLAPNGEKKEIKGIDLERMIIHNRMSNPKNSIKDVFESIEVGEETLDGVECYTLLCKPAMSQVAPFVFYVGKNDFLVKKISTDRDGAKYDAVIRAYSKIDGVVTATETSISFAGNEDTMTVMEFKLNVDVPDSEFGL